ncbi:DUF3017 domain-containing protein [Streptomyces sp. NPDC020719]|uniref:DUF3017 domain-containing protein n=1 Tax=Streptomyces sp. NPDC020719 TaxID=3154896 RepID=UPI0033DA2D8F
MDAEMSTGDGGAGADDRAHPPTNGAQPPPSSTTTGPEPSPNGAEPSVTGGRASVNGAASSANGAEPSGKGAKPSGKEGVKASANGAKPSANGVKASANGAKPSVNGVQPSVNGTAVAAPAPRKVSRRFPSITRDTARPEGGGRAASGASPAPARQWPLLAVLGSVGLGLLLVSVDLFRVGLIIIGLALLAGAVLRWILPSVGMLAVRSRFTDITTYGVLGTVIVLLALVAQPKPWLDIPFLEDAVRFTVR